MSGFAVNLNIQNCENSTRNCVHYIFTKRLDLLKNWTSRTAKIHRDIVYIIYVQNVNISWKIEYSELQKFNGKLCKLYMYGMSRFAEKLNVQNFINLSGNCLLNMYGMSGFAEKLNIQNCENSTGNCVRYMCTKSLDLQKIWIFKTAKIEQEIVYIIYARNVLICRKFEYPELRKFN